MMPWALGGLAVNWLLPGCGHEVRAFEGHWEVVGHEAPGFSALGPEDAAALVGTGARFDRDQAVFGDRRCPTPTYASTSLSRADFLDGYRVNPADLRSLPDPIERVEVECRSGDWSGPGTTLILREDGWMYTPWDGTFFELRPVPVASHTEPLTEAP